MGYTARMRHPAPARHDHDAKVAAVASTVRELAASKEPVHIEKGGVHHFVPLPGDTRFQGRKVDVSALREILDIDVDRRLCTAEPGVTFAEVVRRTLPLGLLPKVVPELEGITLGGAVAGCSVESMSYKVGGFHDTCREYEVVTGTGERRVVGRDQDAELFHMLHGSYGTLAILTRIVFELTPAKPFVKLEYRKHAAFPAFHADMKAQCAAADVDFVDGILHSPTELVLCVGRFVDEAAEVSSYRGTEIFYKSTRTHREDTLTTFDYCFRYDTECHWLSRTVPALEWKPVRWAVGRWFLGSTNLLKWTKRLDPMLGRVMKRPDVVVDVFVPGKRFEDFWRWYEKDFAYWPLWIVPYRVPTPYPWISPGHTAKMNDDLMIDCAVYGKKNGDPKVDWSQVLEEKTYELGGIKTLISRNHYSKEQFWEIYDEKRWRAAKQALDPNGFFKDLYEKFAPSA
jgi:FAD/FMN-containing dehydrogenase